MAYFVDLKTFSDARGNLTVIEREIPFEIKRIFYIYGASVESRRGGHRHISTVHALVCINGSCEVLIDDGTTRETVLLDRPDRCLVLAPEDWHEMFSFTENAVLLVLASDYYDTHEYIMEGYR
jgi:dTDP-4-dehydrorhamnose 3,5-epimerase-like enzyme